MPSKNNPLLEEMLKEFYGRFSKPLVSNYGEYKRDVDYREYIAPFLKDWAEKIRDDIADTMKGDCRHKNPDTWCKCWEDGYRTGEAEQYALVDKIAAETRKETLQQFKKNYNDRQVRYMRKRVEAGLCKICAKPLSKTNKELCEFHREKKNAVERKRFLQSKPIRGKPRLNRGKEESEENCFCHCHKKDIPHDETQCIGICKHCKEESEGK